MRFSILIPLTILSLTVAGPVQKRRNFWYFGVNESGAEFGNGNIPGTLGTDYTWPVDSTIDTLYGEGFNIFRIPFLMERAVPNSLTGSISSAYVSEMVALVNHITSKGGYAAICAQNFGRYYGNIIQDTSGFQAFWKTIATQFKSNGNVIFDINNEFHDMDETLVVNLNQAGINGIRAAGATTQTIFVEGNSYTAASNWASVNDAMKSLTDPQGRLIYEMHLYLDSDGSGTHVDCVSTTIGVERAQGATAWLKANGKLGIIGEFAGGANNQCNSAVAGLLEHLEANNDVWTGAMWWGGGPWWGDYMFSFEPPSGTGYEWYLNLLKGFQ